MMMAPLAACATMEEPAAAPKGACRNEVVAGFVGRAADADTGAAMLKASGAKTLRWGGPGMAMTMDFRPDRLTVTYDEAMVITSARCG
ncbi:MAG: I78 family peptidase inhibitor [Sphingobium sp.]|nr:I78 family peptidase inhibitor [Sphingobium sp.]